MSNINCDKHTTWRSVRGDIGGGHLAPMHSQTTDTCPTRHTDSWNVLLSSSGWPARAWCRVISSIAEQWLWVDRPSPHLHRTRPPWKVHITVAHKASFSGNLSSKLYHNWLCYQTRISQVYMKLFSPKTLHIPNKIICPTDPLTKLEEKEKKKLGWFFF